MQKKILVIGSSNTDMVIKTARFPAPGETILGGRFLMNPGGKGANQAVAAARLGGSVAFIAKTGNDLFGKQAASQFEKEGIDAKGIIIDEELPSGVALITVDGEGENCIVVAQGANGNLMPGDLSFLQAMPEDVEYILLQMEIPISTVSHIAKVGKMQNKKVVLNPAPAVYLDKDIYPNLYLITPNKTEISILTGVNSFDTKSIEVAARMLQAKGVQNVVVTMGAEGAFVLSENEFRHIPAQAVAAIDTTAAGDVFNGALTVALNEGKNLFDAVEFANSAAAISVTKMGAQSSIPYRHEVQVHATTPKSL